MDSDDDLAHELLFGIPSSDANGRYHKRIYLEPGTKRERQARAALARLLRTEAPYGFYTAHLAALIDPPPGSELIERKVEFVRRRGGHRSTRRLDLEIYEFFKNKPGLDPNIGPTELIRAAKKHFKLSRTRILQAWTEFQPRRPKPEISIKD